MSGICSKALSFGQKNSYKFNAGTDLNSDFSIDYYETPLRQYDPQIGRFTGIDVLAENTFWINPYEFGINNPVSFNDPSGALSSSEFNNVFKTLWNSPNGGSWSSKGSIKLFGSEDEAFGFGAIMMSENGWWGGSGGGTANSFNQAANRFNGGQITPAMVAGYLGFKYLGKDFNISVSNSANCQGFSYSFSGAPLGSMENSGVGFISLKGVEKIFRNGETLNWAEKSSIVLDAFDLTAVGAGEQILMLDPRWKSLGYTEVANGATKTIFALQAVLSAYNVVNLWQSDASTREKVTGTGKAAVDITVARLSMMGGGVGLFFGGIYFLADVSGLNGGINRAMERKINEFIERMKKQIQ